MKNKKEWAVIKTVFLNGETSYNLNLLKEGKSPESSFIDRVLNWCYVDIQLDRNLSDVNSRILEGDFESCESIKTFRDLAQAKQLVNFLCQNDPLCIRTRLFKI
jgi:hypothetical protein